VSVLGWTWVRIVLGFASFKGDTVSIFARNLRAQVGSVSMCIAYSILVLCVYYGIHMDVNTFGCLPTVSPFHFCQTKNEKIEKEKIVDFLFFGKNFLGVVRVVDKSCKVRKCIEKPIECSIAIKM